MSSEQHNRTIITKNSDQCGNKGFYVPNNKGLFLKISINNTLPCMEASYLIIIDMVKNSKYKVCYSKTKNKYFLRLVKK